MEFEGRLQRVLPVRSGTSQKGAEWKSLPFVFEYFEADNKMYSSKVYLETMDHEVMRAIGKYVERGPDNKGIVENGVMRLKCDVRCRVGFSVNVREYEGKLFNQLRCYKFEPILETEAQPTAQQQAQSPFAPPQAQSPFALPQQQQLFAPPQQAQSPFAPPQDDGDDLPF